MILEFEDFIPKINGMHLLTFVAAILVYLCSSPVWAYPAFISYGYNSCVSCHYNGQGGGSLNEYGKAVMASELSSRIFYPNNVTEEQLAENSGFPGGAVLPGWLKPGIKYRGLWFQTDPGSQKAISKYVTMAADLNLAVLFDENQKYVAVVSAGYNSNSLGGGGENFSRWISREHYLRVQHNENLQIYYGLMDKVFGIRIVDHTAYSRAKVGIAQNDQTHGVMAILTRAPWEYTGHVFVGNLSQESSLRQKGFSVMAEKDVKNMLRVGGSAMYSNNQYIKWTRVAAHSKYGFSKGNSLLSEIGMIQNSPTGAASATGLYAMLESLSLIDRGMHFLSQFEFYNETMSTKTPDKTKWSLGLLMFPAPRFELRATAVNGRSISDTSVANDSWSAQVQLHVVL